MTRSNEKGYRAVLSALGRDIRSNTAGKMLVERIAARPGEYERLLEVLRRDHPFFLCDLSDSLAESRRVEEQLRDAAIYDPLTKLHTRRYFDSRFDEEFSEARRTGNPLSLTIFDIDHFKNVNDVYGHSTGDEVLRRVAYVINTSTRKSDINARYGGEEFTRLMPRTDLDGAMQAGEAVRERVGNTIIEAGGHKIHVTLSGGVSVYPLNGYFLTPCNMYDIADHALYNAKHSGRNRIASVSDMRPETIERIIKGKS